MTKKEVARLLERIKKFYPVFEASRDRVLDWHPFLANHDTDEVFRNLDEHIKQQSRIPTIGDLITHRPVNASVLAGDAAIREAEEWERQAVPPTDEFLRQRAALAASSSGEVKDDA